MSNVFQVNFLRTSRTSGNPVILILIFQQNHLPEHAGVARAGVLGGEDGSGVSSSNKSPGTRDP